MLLDYDVCLGFIALFFIFFSPLWQQRAARVRGLGIMIGIAFLFMQSIARSAYIPSGSMSPTLKVDDRVFVWVLESRLLGPKIGDIVLFRSPETGEMLCKRVVGLADDVIEVKEGALFRNGQQVQEPYLAGPTLGSFGPYEVPPGTFFVMGDRRNNSRDSRFYGAVPMLNLAGEVVAVFWPLQRFQRV